MAQERPVIELSCGEGLEDPWRGLGRHEVKFSITNHRQHTTQYTEMEHCKKKTIRKTDRS